MNHDKELSWEQLGSLDGPALPLFRARFDQVRHPQSGQVMKRLVLESVDWVNVVALTSKEEVILVRQYRFGVASTTLEPPGGMVDPGETPLAAARRELEEETGYRGGRWQSLGAVQPNPAYHDHLCHHWLAEGVERGGPPAPTAGEAIQVERVTQAQIVAAVQRGEIQHALALSVLSRVFDLWPPARDRNNNSSWETNPWESNTPP